MLLAQGKIVRTALALTLIFSAWAIQAQQSSGTLRGRVVDELGGLIIGARVTVKNGNGEERTAVTDASGSFQLSALVPGKYVVQASAPGFALYEKRDTEVSAQTSTVITIALTVAPLQQEVTTNTSPALNTDPESNAGAIILKSKELDALPDDPDELANALQALAGPSAGPSGGQIFIDGFTSARLPAKESIREVRINQNPFSAEFDRIGLGRIDILTKPGADKFHGQGSFNFGDESLNSRNPFAPTRVPFQERNYTGSLSGPIKVKKASFFVDFGRRETDTNVIINASILDSALNVIRFNSGVLTPQRRTNFSSRFDYQVNKKNTVTGRYTVTRASFKNSGLSDLTLPSVAYPSSSTEQVVQLTETAVVSPKVINETRFQYIFRHSKTDGDNSLPTINVLDAFTDGGAQIGKTSYSDHRWELQNYTLYASGNHTLRVGGRLRGVHVTDSSPLNFGGTFTFGSGNGPQLSSDNRLVLDGNAQPLLITLSSIERYRRTLLFQQQGLSASEIRALGGGATQFSIATGSPLAKVNQIDFGPFIQDDWRLRPNFTLSLGLRYETQSNIHDRTDFAPRVSFAWGLRGNRTQPAMVIRGGFGVFYDRFPENLTLYATRFNGLNQQRFVINNPDFFPAVPSGEFLASLQVPQTITRVAQDLKTPYTMQSAVSLERQLPLRLIVSATFINTRTVHALRSRNVNAPLPGTFDPSVPGSGIRPLDDLGNILEYESSAWFNQNQLLINIKNQVNSRFSFFATYNLSKANADSDGVDSFPANSYDLHSEYGRSGLDTRHRFVFVGVVDLPRGFSLNPFIVMRSGLPFNIITGRDTNGDALFTERPALAIDASKPGVVVTPFGALDPDSTVGQRIIPRNFAEGPGFIAVNIRLSKIFGFGSIPEKSGTQSTATQQQKKKPTGGEGQRTLNIYGNAPIKQRYQLTFSVQVRNLLNRSNFGLPIGNLGSLFFGSPNSLAPSSGFGISGDPIVANRRIETQIRFTF